MVGNGATDWDFDVSPSFPEVAFHFNLIPQSLLETYQAKGCEYYFNDLRPHNGTDDCDGLWDQINDSWEGLNWYDLFRPGDNYSASVMTAEERKMTINVNGEEKEVKKGFVPSEYMPWLKKNKAYMARAERDGEPVLG